MSSRVASLLAILAVTAPMQARAQVAPRMVIAFDTSGSMAMNLDGVPTFGDGVTTGCTRMASGHYCGTDCTAGIDTDCDGEPNDSRMAVAKEAVRNMLLSTGDIEFALSRFDQRHQTDAICNATRMGPFATEFSIDTVECTSAVSSYGNPQCNTDTAVSQCGNLGGGGNWLVDVADFPATCRPGSGGNPPLRELQFTDAYSNTDGNALTNPFICLDYIPDSCDATAASGNLLVGFPGLGAYAGRTNVFGMLKWIDGQETSWNTTTTTADWCSHAGSGDCELRPIGRTPLAGILLASRDYIVSTRSGDTAAACRPYSIILLTDGVETCGGNPSSVAGTLRTSNDILTYVVGVSIDPAEQPTINAIAASGGTGSAYFADNPVALAAALSDIVASSLLVETCNGLDDDCDTLIDEGVTNACGACGAVPSEACNGADDDCDGTVDEGVSNACGGCGPTPVETCNRLDDDCDGIIDEDGSGGDICAGCTPTAEVCDGLDNDCDSAIDEGLSRSCGTDVGECTAGAQTCSDGGWGTCVGSVGPTAEVCDGRDNDCDGSVDGMSRACGTDVGACVSGAEVCTAGSWGSCIGSIGPSGEICDGEDDDCDGTTDEGDPGGGAACGSALGECSEGVLRCIGGALTCTGGVGPEPETCNARDDDCDGATDESVPTMGACGVSTGECSEGVLSCVSGAFVCVGGRGATTEVCDGLDNDCDGTADEGNPGGGATCGNSTGICTPGTSACTGGSLTCVGGTGPGTESCNALDDDCDGLVDEGNPGGGAACGTTDVGACEFGAEACSMGALVCVGATGPSAELCDGVDNDCDAMIDEGNPEGGGACGDDTGECMAGTFLCTAGALVCSGALGPTPELCNGLDDDCDGVVDDGIAVGTFCGTDVGECVPGVNICRGGALVCEGAIEPEPESCDSLDNDCDGMIDEGLGVGEPCGTDVGLCMPGLQRCVDGRLLCDGEIGPRRESCDCEDNDCDGDTDEPPDTGSLCPPGSACVECGCALPCMESEFGFTCPTGRAPQVDGAGACYCVAPRCDAAACATETVEQDGEVRCAPDRGDVSHCVCSNNTCTFPCEGVTCSEGRVCDPRDPGGRCVEDSCRGLGCPGGEICDPLSGECMPDACADVTCAAQEACRAGTCEASCGSVTCSDGEICRSGVCSSDPCAAIDCDAGEICDDTGACVADLCETVRCAAGQVCELATGNCVADPCDTLRCPEGQTCEDGECAREAPMMMDAGVDAGRRDAGGRPEDPRDRVLAAGGGCNCHVGASEPASGSAAWLLALGVALVVVGRRRRASSRGAFPFVAAVVVGGLASGCDVDPFCLDCAEAVDAGTDGGTDAGRRDAGRDAGADAGSDAGPDGCVEGAEEVCNAADDDCDGMIDEGIDIDVDLENCGGCGELCAPIGAFGECVAGVCGISSCDVGRHDLDGDPANGCEYRCLQDADDDSVCDLRDNDCDGSTDEDVDRTTDSNNCGTCGRVCRFAHASASCVDGGCVLGACDTDWHDVDGAPGNGCEYSCTPAGATESCNGRDDDCDGSVDEGDPEGGGACGTSTGECGTGVDACIGGTIVCSGAVGPTTELCDGLDNDCDGTADESNPEGGRVCGTSTGTCESGREVCTGGTLVCTGEVGPTSETCDGLDNDCDGSIDEGNPEGGGTCGADTGECAFGVQQCRGGVLVCEGAVGPSDETCDGQDDDCDGMIDEGAPGAGGSCGTDVGTCSPGVLRCVGGALACDGAVGAGTESCNSLDDDCDGSIDEGNPEGGAACGTNTGACVAGTMTCLGGTLQCVGSTGPALEVCNAVDDDCDGTADEGFDLTSDVRNCGSCGNVCSLANATETCIASSCRILACDAGWHDRDGLDGTGCEYDCDFNGAEICNGVDDDCDGVDDDGLTPPSTFCNPNGVCGGATPSCGGASGWVCSYPASYEETETTCDGLDNDCDGAVDEPFPSVGTSCANGTGGCRRTGMIACTADGSGTYCTAPAAGTPAGFESCNNVDDDCDGSTDESIPASAIPTVTIPRPSGGTVRVMTYEASRPDATASSAGTVEVRACSNANVLPWTNITWDRARAACCALNSSGTCAGSGAGWRLCDAEDWQAACAGPSSSCEWSYASSCSSSSRLTCNGEEHDSSSLSGDQDALYPTASSTFGMCFTDWSSAGVIYDLSGNVKEWTNTATAAGVYQIRGGAYNNVEEGRTCQFGFTVGEAAFSFPHTGFRCCFY